jgi:hypothetical protein
MKSEFFKRTKGGRYENGRKGVVRLFARRRGKILLICRVRK